jgi:hypothetical protein
MEFASMLAAMETNIPTARVASTNTKAEARIPTLASEPLDAIRQEAGLHPNSGEMLNSEPAFTSFPPSLDGDALRAGMVAPFRVRLAKSATSPVVTSQHGLSMMGAHWFS